MAGHNKWSKIKRLKGALDNKRGKLFSRFAKEITVAARLGGADPGTNVRLRTAIQAAKSQNMPGDTIERALKKGSGDTGSQALEEIIYEGYAPGGVAVMVECATDNKNRTAADLRHIFSKNHGNLGTQGSVAYLFARRGRITTSGVDEARLLELVIESGADEYLDEEDHYTILTPPDRLYQVADHLRNAGFEPADVQLVFQPLTHVMVNDESAAQQAVRLCEALEECDDVQSVYANLEFSGDLSIAE